MWNLVYDDFGNCWHEYISEEDTNTECVQVIFYLYANGRVCGTTTSEAYADQWAYENDGYYYEKEV